MTQDELKQRDLSHLAIEEMSQAERAEMRRRYLAFIQSLGQPSPPRPPEGDMPRAVRPWQPGRGR